MKPATFSITQAVKTGFIILGAISTVLTTAETFMIALPGDAVPQAILIGIGLGAACMSSLVLYLGAYIKS